MVDAFSDWIGRSVTRDDVVTARLVAEYRAALSPWLFEPSETGHCPPGLHWGLAPATPGYDDVGTDGAEARGLFLPPIPLPRRMWAGGSIETMAPIAAGQSIRRTSRIADIKRRDGRAGQLYLVSVTHEIAQDDRLVLRERQDLVFREGAPKQAAATEGAPIPGDAGWTVDPTPLMLFRFSAFTFNGHRIHYDAPYAAEEGYPGLVVHGPLQAALMLNRISNALGLVPQKFDYRCVAPLFSGNPFQVVHDPSTLATRIVRHDGVTTAEGQVPVQET